MLLAFSTNAFGRFSLEGALRAIGRTGFGAVEILADAPHADPDHMDRAAIKKLRALLQQTRLRVSNLNANCSFGYWRHAPPEPYFEPSLLSPLAAHRRDRKRRILKTLDMAHELACANISITSGRCLADTPPQLAAVRLVEQLKGILDYADRRGVDVGIECEPGLYIEYAAELADLIEQLKHPRLGANLDIGHSQVQGENIPRTVALLAGKIWNLHVEDIAGRKHYHLIPGQGTVPWCQLRDALRRTGYQRFVTVELYTQQRHPAAAARQSLEFLRTIFD